MIEYYPCRIGVVQQKLSAQSNTCLSIHRRIKRTRERKGYSLQIIDFDFILQLKHLFVYEHPTNRVLFNFERQRLPQELGRRVFKKRAGTKRDFKTSLEIKNWNIQILKMNFFEEVGPCKNCLTA